MTLEENSIAMFPDAPTERGAKHIRELVEAKAQGYEAGILFLIQMKGVSLFRPHKERDKAFANELVQAANQGVQVFAYDCQVQENGFSLDAPVPVEL